MKNSELRYKQIERSVCHILQSCLIVVGLSTGTPSFAQIAPGQSSVFEREVSEVANLLKNAFRFKKLSQEQRQDLIKFVAGNVVFVMLHEFAHAAVTDLEIPMLGPEEDAADYFAIIELLHMELAFSHRVLVDAAEGWFLSHRRDRYEKEPLYFHDEHGLDQQRAYRIVCLMVGFDPIKFKDLADDAKLPEDR